MSKAKEKKKYCFGVDIGGTTVKIGLFTADGDILEKWEIPTRIESEGAAILPDIAAALLRKLLELSIEKTDVLGIGVGVPAPVTPDGVVNGSANLGWNYKEAGAELYELTGLSCRFGNDANVAALGEMWKGSGMGHKNMVMVTLGTGVGGGVIVDGHVLTGSHGAGGEIGHICVNPTETRHCGCGRKGCLEQYASARGIARLASEKMETETRETKLLGTRLTSKDVFDAVKEGDEVADEIAQEMGNCLARGLANLAVVTDPSLFVIGGGVSNAGEVLLPYIAEPYKEVAFFSNKDAEFVLASLGNDAGICGAAKLVLDAG